MRLRVASAPAGWPPWSSSPRRSSSFWAWGRAWAHDYILWQVVRDVVFVALLVFLGIRLGGEEQSPEGAVRRAIRAFVLLCAVLVFAALDGSTPGWAVAAVVTRWWRAPCSSR